MTTLAMLAVILAGCGGSASSDCRAAAEAQAQAEIAWGMTVEAHDAAHVTGDEHAAAEGQLFTDRVEMIIATAEVQRAC